MRAAHARGVTAAAANAERVEITDFAVDPNGVQLGRNVANEIAQRMQGNGGHAYIGDKGDPNQSWNGYAPSAQVFRGASTQGHNPVVSRDQSGGDIATGVNDEGPFADVTQRVFAQRLARRSPM